MHALCEVFTLNGTTVFSATLAQLSFCLTDVVITTSWAGDDIKQITSVTCEMVAELKGFIRAFEMEFCAFFEVVTTLTRSSALSTSIFVFLAR